MVMKLRPSGKLRRRYLLFKGKREDVEKAVLDYIGILGWSKSSPVFVKDNILAVNREEVDNVIAGIALDGKAEVLKVSGTLKGLEK
jgi:RNase P/RNase MRP subunit POP5